MEQAIELVQSEWLAVSEVRKRVNAIQDLLENVMKKDVHYGVIPGTKKPSLWKPGSEQILSMFQLAIDPIVEDLSNTDEARYRVLCRITDKNGRFLGAGVGEASSNEQKYKWRSVVSKAEWEWHQKNAPERSRIKFAYGDKQIEQVRTEIADVSNTILKMAKKRAQVDATLTVTGCSDIFEQDAEDMPQEMVDEFNQDQPRTQEPVKPTTKKTQEPKQEAAAPAKGECITEGQRNRLIAIQSTLKVPDDKLKAYMVKEFGLTSRNAIPKSMPYTYGVYECIVDWIDPKFTAHTDDFDGHVIGTSKHKNSSQKQADDNW